MSSLSKVAVITGGSSGIGAATARQFSQKGYNIIVAGRNEGRLQDVVKGLDNAKLWAGDLSSAKSCNDLIAFTMSQYGRLDVLINCAGVIFRKDAENTSDHEWEETMAINLNAPFYLSRAAIAPLKKLGGAIINIASDWGLQGGQQAVAYCASKGGLVLLTKSMALDHAKDKVRVNAICPGDVDTPMLEIEAAQRGMDYTQAMTENNAESPTGRVTTSDEVAALCLYLASDAAEQITGTAIPIDGGNTA